MHCCVISLISNIGGIVSHYLPRWLAALICDIQAYFSFFNSTIAQQLSTFVGRAVLREARGSLSSAAAPIGFNSYNRALGAVIGNGMVGGVTGRYANTWRRSLFSAFL